MLQPHDFRDPPTGPCDGIAVVVRHRRVLVCDGRTYGEGDILQLPPEDVTTLEEHGIVTRPSQAPHRSA